MTPIRRRTAQLVAALTAALVALWLPASPALAADDATWQQPPVNVSVPGAFSQYAKLVSSRDGLTVAAVWARENDSYYYEVQAAVSYDGAQTWEAPQILSTDSFDGEYPEVAMSADGSKIAAVWYSGSGGNEVVKVATSTDSGKTWGDQQPLSDANLSSFGPNVVWEPDGSAVVVTWANPDARDVEVSRSTDGGEKWSNPKTVGGTYSALLAYPELAISRDGSKLVQLWRGDTQASADEQFWVSSSSDAGQTWSKQVRIPGTEQAYDPQLAMSEDGSHIHVVWTITQGKEIVYDSVSTDGGATWTTPERVSAAGNPPSVDSYYPQVAVSADGMKVSVVWNELRQGQHGGQNGVDFRTSEDGGSAWGPIKSISTEGWDSVYPHLTASDNGRRITAAWAGAETGSRLAQAITSIDGGATWGAVADLSEEGEDIVDDQYVHVTSSANGAQLAAVWLRPVDNYDVVQAAAGTVPVAEFVADPTALDYGSQAIGTTVDKTVTVTNPGTGPLFISTITPDSSEFKVTNDTCATVVAGGTCEVTVQFAPTAAGSKSGNLVFTDNTDAGSNAVDLSGSATATPGPTPTPTPSDRNAQKPLNAKGKPPHHIKVNGLTVLTGRNARTTAGERIQTRVLGGPVAQGEVRYYRVIRGPQGKVSIRTYGYKNLKVVLVQSARGTSQFKPYRKRTVYVGGVKR